MDRNLARREQLQKVVEMEMQWDPNDLFWNYKFLVRAATDAAKECDSKLTHYYLNEGTEDFSVFQVSICHGFDGKKFSSKA